MRLLGTAPGGKGHAIRSAVIAAAFSVAAMLPSAALAATFQVIHHFSGEGGDGVDPQALTFGENPNELYGVTRYYGGIFKLTPGANGGRWRREMLFRFPNYESAYAGLTPFRGKLYGVTDYGSSDLSGSVYEFDPATRNYRVIFSFDKNPARSGASPQALLLAWKGALWGTTTSGGAGGYGTIFRLTPPKGPATQWTPGILKAFRGPNGANGGRVGLTARRGVLFGGTFSGGREGDGTLFSLRESEPGSDKWEQKVLSSFRGGNNGSYPESPLLLSQNGRLYGTSDSDSPYLHNGTFFRMKQQEGRWVRQILFRFQINDGESGYPSGRLVEDSKGRIYGVTSGSVDYGDFGSVYRLIRPTRTNPQWRIETLHRFRVSDGRAPQWGVLLREKDGKVTLFGTTEFGGRFDEGTVFKLTVDR